MSRAARSAVHLRVQHIDPRDDDLAGSDRFISIERLGRLDLASDRIGSGDIPKSPKDKRCRQCAPPGLDPLIRVLRCLLNSDADFSSYADS